MVGSVHTGPAVGFAAQLLVLAGLGVGVGLAGVGWVVGVAYGVVVGVLLARALRTRDRRALLPADWVTLARAALVGGVAALTAASFVGPISVPVLVALSSVALALDALDGQVARRTGTASELGARFDMEVDAFLILVLSVYVSNSVGWWVLILGLARYAYVAASWGLPWLRTALPSRYWRKVVAASVGIVLTVTSAAVLPASLCTAALLVCMLLLAESFGRDVRWQWWHRPDPDGAQLAARPTPGRAVVRGVVTGLAVLLVVAALVAPNDLDRLRPAVFLRIPIEGLLLVAIALALPRRGRRAVALATGLLLGMLTVVKVADMGFLVAFGRPSNPAIDWTYFGSAVDLLGLSLGRREAVLLLVVGGLVVVAVLVLMPWAVLRVTDAVAGHPTAWLRATALLGVAWIAFAVLGISVVQGEPIASASETRIVAYHARQVVDRVQDERTFAEAAAVDPLRQVADDQLLTGLRGKDVILAFVESYGRVAVQDSSTSAGVDAVLDAGTARLHAAGFDARSAFLTSPTFGGISWLAHSTLQSGLWIDSQPRYDELLQTRRTTLSTAFQRAGWRTVADIPSNEQDWSQGSAFYGYDTIYDARNVGYRGPPFGYASMPDQYVLSAFHERELADPDHAPVMAEIDLVSSHTPWTPLPRPVDWSEVGDGSVFGTMPGEGPSRDVLWRDAEDVRTAYGRSIEYTLDTLVSFVETYGDDNLVLVVLGDHQPATIVSGSGASHDVPITIIAHDPDVLARIAGWGWQEGMRPHPDAPVWRMDAFRDRFLAAYARPPALAAAAP